MKLAFFLRGQPFYLKKKSSTSLTPQGRQGSVLGDLLRNTNKSLRAKCQILLFSAWRERTFTTAWCKRPELRPPWLHLLIPKGKEEEGNITLLCRWEHRNQRLSKLFCDLEGCEGPEESASHTVWLLTWSMAIPHLLSMSPSSSCEQYEEKTELYLIFYLQLLWPNLSQVGVH